MGNAGVAYSEGWRVEADCRAFARNHPRPGPGRNAPTGHGAALAQRLRLRQDIEVARTIADFATSDRVEQPHLLKAHPIPQPRRQ